MRCKLAVFHTADGANRLMRAGRRTARMRRNGHGDTFLDGIIVRGIFGGENRLELLFARSAYRESAVFPSPAFGKSYVCKRVFHANCKIFGRSIYGHCLVDYKHRRHIGNHFVIVVVACKLCRYGVRACVFLAVAFVRYGNAVGKRARNCKAVRLAVVGNAAVFKGDTRHIVGGFCYRQRCRHIGTGGVIRIAHKRSGDGVFARVHLTVIRVVDGNACGKIARNCKAVRLAVVGNGRTLERNARHIVGDFCNGYIGLGVQKLFFAVQRIGIHRIFARIRRQSRDKRAAVRAISIDKFNAFRARNSKINAFLYGRAVVNYGIACACRKLLA